MLKLSPKSDSAEAEAEKKNDKEDPNEPSLRIKIQYPSKIRESEKDCMKSGKSNKDLAKEEEVTIFATAKQAAKAVPAGRTSSAISNDSLSSTSTVKSSELSPSLTSNKKSAISLPSLIAEGSDINTDTRLIDVAVLMIKCAK